MSESERSGGQGTAALLVLGVCLAGAPVEAAVPANFSDTLVANVAGDVPGQTFNPTAIAFTPDGRLLVTSQQGRLRVYTTAGALLSTAITFGAGGAPAICSNSERGLLGVAVDPAFATTQHVFLYYTFNSPGGCVNRTSRFTLPASNVIDPASQLVLVDNMTSTAGNHNAGDVNFGKDGHLYITIGDGGCDYAGDSGCGGANDAARDQHRLTGKLLRITKNGNIPGDNPFQGAGTARCNVTGTTAGDKCQETFAWGLRNPFRFAMDPNAAATRLFINDVGQNLWEEIDLGQGGVDYGWNCREGAHTNSTIGPCNPTPSGMVDPIFEYQHGVNIPGTTGSADCGSVTGAAFVPNGLWPGFDGKYLFTDSNCSEIVQMTGTAPFTAANFATSMSGATIHLEFGPHGAAQALYYANFVGGGQVRRIAYNVAGNNAPSAVIGANPRFGLTPLNVTFNATGSSDPDAGNTLTYFWDFGDGTPETSTASLTINHVYAANGNYTARLRARDDNFAFSNPVTILIQAGNTPPVPSINTPTPATLFSVGQAITLNGSATDPQQGPLPASALSWRVWLHHAAHEHPFLGPMGGNNVPFNAPAPEDLLAATNSYLRIELTATDAGGLSQTISQDLDPRAVNLTFNTVPAGLGLTVNLINPITGPQTIVSWANWALDVRAATQNDAGGRTWALRNWSDGLPARHTLVTPSTNATYTATFRPPKGDADSDGRVDLFFRNLGTNRHLAWLMNGVTRSSESFLSPDPANANWAAVGADDFNSDDRNDFVFSNGATGAVEFWLMNGATRVGGAVPLTGSPPPGLDWKLSATGDFNHDGRPDLVWRNVATRKIAVWTLNGTAYTATLVPNPDSAADANWEIAAGLDYNGDGLRDWLWYNVTSGKLVLWFLDANLQRTAGQFTNPPSAADANWRVLGGGDYGQGPGGVAFSNDVVWRNSTSGRLVVWYLDFAGNRTAGTFTNPVGPTAGASTPLDWTVVGPR